MKIQVCTGKSCSSKYSEYIIKRLKSDKDFYNYDNLIIENCMCTWNCEEWPIIYVDKDLHKKVNPSLASKLVLEKIKAWLKNQKRKDNKSNNKK